MAKLNLGDYEPVTSKPLNMDEYEVIGQSNQEPEGPLTLKIPFTNLKYDIGQTPVIGKPLETGATALEGILGKTTAGIAKGLTLGALDPERGTIGIPVVQNLFPQTRLQVTKPAAETMIEQGVPEAIAENPYIGLPGEIAGSFAPVGAISRGVSTATNLIGKGVKGLTAGTELANIGEKAAQNIPTVLQKAGQLAGRVGHAATVGGIVGTTEDIQPGKSVVNNIERGAIYGAGLQVLGEGVGAIGNAVKLADKWRAYRSLRDSLAEWAYGEGKYNSLDAAKKEIGAMLNNDIKKAGGLGNVTKEQAQRMQEYVKSQGKPEPVNVTQAAEATKTEIPPVERRVNTELREAIETAPESQKPAIVNIARNMERWKARADQEGRSWVDVMREEIGITPKESMADSGRSGIIEPEELTRGKVSQIQTENQIETQPEIGTKFETGEGRIGQTEDLSQGMGENIRIKIPRTIYADMGGYAEKETPSPTIAQSASAEPSIDEAKISAIQMPELVELAKSINEGKVPRVKVKLGKALGYFRPGKGNIDLRADIFKDPQKATRVMAHEIGHLVDWLPDKSMARGNILGRIASLKKYMKHILPEKPGAAGELTQADRNRLRKEAEQIIKNQKAVEGEDIGISPKDIIAIWNDVGAKEKNKDLYEYIAKLSAAEKKQILKDAFKGEVNFTLPKDSYRNWDKEIIDKYQELIRKEIVKRKLFEYETINNELKDLSMRWKPFDPTADRRYTAYRNSSPELYADAISVLFNDPGLLKQQAPNFYKAFFNYLEQKPNVKAVYEEIQNRLTNPEEVGKHRIEGIYQMLEEGNKIREEAVKRGMPKPEKMLDSIEKMLIDRDQALLKQIRRGKKQGGETAKLANKTQRELEETKYMAAETNDYISSIDKTVMKPLKNAGLNVTDIGAYMLAKRAATERATIANPRGLDEEAAKKLLDDLKTKLGSAKFVELEKAVDAYRNLREDVVIPAVEDAGMYSQELIDLMKSSKNYARFNVLHYLEEKFGGQGTARIYKQIGTLSDIENPFIATVVQDISMLRAAKMNQAKSTALDFLKAINEAAPAEKVFDANVGAQVAREPRDPEMKLFSVLKGGKMESYYVHKDIAESFERNPVEANAIARFMSTITNPLKQILVSKNPIWMARNLIRDVKATVKNVPEIRLRDIPKLGKYYNQAFREVIQEVFKGNRSEDIAAMYKGYMLNPNRAYSGKDVSFENEIERLVAEFQVSPSQAVRERGVRGKLKAAWETLDRLGRVSELTGKVAGYKYLKANSKLSQSEIGHVVRTRIGTPDARRQGSLHQLTNNIFMFSNINKEGIRSSIEAFNANRGAYIWKTMMMNVVPKLVLIGAAVAGSKELKELIAKIPEYDKQMYDIIPIGMNKEGKAVYIRIPQDYEGQLWGALTWALSGGKFIGARGVLDTIGEQNPYNLNPIIKVGADLYTYYVMGRNPTDDYRGQPIIPEKAYTTGGLPASIELLKRESKSLGLSPLYSFGDYSDRNTSRTEQLLKLPGLSVLGTFLKISDRGELERFYEEEAKEKQQNAKRLLKVENRVIESVKNKKELPTVADMVKTYRQLKEEGLIKKGMTFPEFKTQYLRYASKVLPGNELKILLKVSKADRIEMLKKYRKEKSPKEYAKLIRDLRKMGVSGAVQ